MYHVSAQCVDERMIYLEWRPNASLPGCVANQQFKVFPLTKAGWIKNFKCMLPSLQAHLQLWAGGRRFFIRSKMHSRRQFIFDFLSNSRCLAAPRTWLHVLKLKRLPPPTPPPQLNFIFKSFLQFVPNMSTRHPRTWLAPHHHHHLLLPLMTIGHKAGQYCHFRVLRSVDRW